jgi:hypothetical protein
MFFIFGGSYTIGIAAFDFFFLKTEISEFWELNGQTDVILKQTN